MASAVHASRLTPMAPGLIVSPGGMVWSRFTIRTLLGRQVDGDGGGVGTPSVPDERVMSVDPTNVARLTCLTTASDTSGLSDGETSRVACWVTGIGILVASVTYVVWRLTA